MMGTMDVTARLHMSRDMEGEPVAELTVDSPPPAILRVDEPEFGLVSVYVMRHWHMPDRMSGGQATADYVWKGIE